MNTIRIKYKKSEHVIEAVYRPLKGSAAPMIDLGTHEFKYLNTGKITREEYFINAYIEGVF